MDADSSRQSVEPTPQPAPPQVRLFSPRSFWNGPLRADAAIDPRSAQMVDGLVERGSVGARPPLRPLDQHSPVQHSGLHGRCQPAGGARHPGPRSPRSTAGNQLRSDSSWRQAGRRQRSAHGHLATGHRQDVGILEDAERGRPLARRRRRRNARCVEQPRSLRARLVARSAAVVGRHCHRPAAARRPDDDPGAEARTHRSCAGDGDTRFAPGGLGFPGDPRRRQQQHGETRFRKEPG